MSNKTSHVARRIVPVVAALMASGAAQAATQTTADGPMPLPVTVQGFLPGHSDDQLSHMLAACAGEAKTPAKLMEAPVNLWHIRIQVTTLYKPRADTTISISMLKGQRVMATKSKHAAGLNTAPNAALCYTVSGLTQDLYNTVFTG